MDPTTTPTGFKTPSRFMAGLITSVLLFMFAFSYFAPALSFSWVKPDAKFDAALQQTLLLMLTLAVGYYIGSSKSSADNGDAIRAQLAAAQPAVQAAAIVAAQALPTGDTPKAIAQAVAEQSKDTPIVTTDAPAPLVVAEADKVMASLSSVLNPEDLMATMKKMYPTKTEDEIRGMLAGLMK